MTSFKKFNIENYPQNEKEFIELLEDFNYSYRQGLEKTPKGRQPIPDDIYDAITEDFRDQFPESSWFDKVEEEEEIEGTEDVIHTKPMLSTEKAYSVSQLEKWANRIRKTAEENNINFEEINFRLTPKLDGLAGKDEDGTFSTRGTGTKGSNITYAFERGVIPIGGRNQGLGEIIIQQSYYEKNLKENFTHPRNVAVGIIKADTLKEHSKKALKDKSVHFVPYSQLNNWEGNVEDLLEKLPEICEHIKNKTDYLIDGFVIETTHPVIKEKMGSTEHHHRWQIALKEKGETATPDVISITPQVGRTGNITPVLEIEPVLLSGAIIRRVTAHNMGNIKKNNIGVGTKIEIIRSGEVIPKIEKVLIPSEDPFDVTHCPSCNHELHWDENEIFLICPNKKECKGQVKEQLLHFFKTLGNCDGFGRKTIETLVENNIKSIEEIYQLNENDFEELSFGPGISKNLVTALKKSLSEKIEDWRLLAAFGIPNLGRGDSKKLLKHFKIEDIENVTAEKIIEIDSFGPKTSVSISNEIKEQIETIKNILNLNFNLEKTKLESELNNIVSSFVNKNILFTGTLTQTIDKLGRPYKRNEIEKIIENLGGKIQKQISNNTNILVYGEKAGSKLKKAETINKQNPNTVQIYSEKEFIEQFKNEIL